MKVPISRNELKSVLAKFRLSSSPCTYGVTYADLRHLDPRAHSRLLDPFNQCWHDDIVSDECKCSQLVPLMKSGKSLLGPYILPADRTCQLRRQGHGIFLTRMNVTWNILTLTQNPWPGFDVDGLLLAASLILGHPYSRKKCEAPFGGTVLRPKRCLRQRNPQSHSRSPWGCRTWTPRLSMS